jgi:hypothetical protein
MSLFKRVAFEGLRDFQLNSFNEFISFYRDKKHFTYISANLGNAVRFDLALTSRRSGHRVEYTLTEGHPRRKGRDPTV